MKKIFATTFVTTGLVASALASPFPPTPTGTVFCDMVKEGPPIVASTPDTPVTGLQLALDTTSATLDTTGFTGGYDFSNGGIAAFDGCHSWYLNIGKSSHSYKPLTWAFDDQKTTNWVASPDFPINLNDTSSSHATSKFLACEEERGTWTLYLQTGKQVPKGVTCTTTELFVGLP